MAIQTCLVTYIYPVTYICPTKFSDVGFCPTKFKLCPTKIKSDQTNVLSSQIFICSPVTSAMESFKRHNPAWIKTTVIMSDKDFTERQAFTKCFPNASLLICLYHTLRTFRREITIEKMGITSAERDRALEIITKIVYSKSEKMWIC